MTDSKSGPAPRKRRFEGVRRLTRSATGWNTVKEGKETVSTLYKTAFSDDESRQIRHETFEEASARQHLRPADLIEAARRQRLTALFFYGAAALAAVSAAYTLLLGGSGYARMIGLFSFGPAVLLFVIGWKSAFRHWQIRMRKLGGYEQYRANPSLWWPREFAGWATGGGGLPVAPKTAQPRGRNLEPK